MRLSAVAGMLPGMTAATVLTAVATLLTHSYTPVYCYPPQAGWQGAVGITMFDDPVTHIHLRYCNAIILRRRPDVDTLAHEILHVEHPDWSERQILDREHAYGAVVLRELNGLSQFGCRR